MTDKSEITNTDLDAPVAWKVSAMKPHTHVTAHKPEVIESQSASKTDAEAYKRHLQANGWIASVTPVFLSPIVRGKARVKTQGRTAPPKWNKDWRLYGDKPTP